MKFLADENFPKAILNLIAKSGHSVKTIQQKRLHGSSDNTVVAIASKEKRVILTFDKDFLENRPEDLKVIVFEFPKIPNSEIILLIPELLKDIVQVKIPKQKKIYRFSKKGLSEIIQ